LARRGFRVTGIDFNPEFIARALSEAPVANVAPTFVVADMRDFPSPEPFDAAFCYFGSFGYFHDDGDAQFLSAVARALRPGARFLLDTHLMETLLPVFRQRDWFWTDPPLNSGRVLEERIWDVQSSRVETTWTVSDETGAVSGNSSIRIYTFPELRALLHANGFEQVEGHDGMTGGALAIGSPRAIIVATRRPD